MPVNQSKIDPTQTDSSLTKRGEENQSPYHTYPRESADKNREKLRRALLSLSGKLEELEEINRKLFQVIDQEKTEQPDSGIQVEENSLHEKSISDTSSRSHLEYQLPSLMEVLKPRLNFDSWGIFLLREDASNPNTPDKEYERVTSSCGLENNLASKDFENEVRSQYACGNIRQAINRKQRMQFPAERGEMLIVPLSLPDGKGGFWAMHFDKDELASIDQYAELLMWGSDMITTCLDKLCRCDNHLSPRGESDSWLGRERIFSLSQLSRAMVHEVNNSMQIILGRAQIVRMNLNKKPDITNQSKVWETIERNANRINGILKNYSDFLHRHCVSSRSPVDTGHEKNLSVPTREVNLHRILESNLSLLQYIMGSSGIELELKNREDLPSVYGEAEELELAFLGLLWGIRDNLTAGGNICIQTFPEKEFLCLSVDWTRKKSEVGKSPAGKESPDITGLNRAIKILRKFDPNLNFENTTSGKGRVAIRIPAV